MTPDEHAWIRTHVWPARTHKTHRETPGALDACACQYGTTSHCQAGHHDACHRSTPMPCTETRILTRSGDVAHFPHPFEHPTPAATGPRRNTAAQVWLADRVCRWVCPCDCHARPRPDALTLF